MKYEVFDVQVEEDIKRYVTVLISENDAQTFPADKANSDYDAFLEQAKLTDKQVKALTPDTWYDFPKE